MIYIIFRDEFDTCFLWGDLPKAGMNVYVLQRLMGHADLSMLRRYLALVEDDLAAAHREHGAVDSLL